MQNAVSRPAFATLRLSLIVSLFLATFLATLSAQSDTATLFGLVKDASGGAIVRAKIRLLNRATNAVRELETDTKGLYYINVLPPGSYDLSVESAGFYHSAKPLVSCL